MTPPERVLLIDTETTGLTDASLCVEAACAVYSVPHATVVSAWSSLIRTDVPDASVVNRVPVELLAVAPSPTSVWRRVARMATRCQAFVAHNAEFDRRFVMPNLVEYAGVAPDLPWICTMDDVVWPRESPSRSLVAIALAHDVGVSSAHRAAADVDLVARLLTRAREMGADIGALLARGMRPKARFVVGAPTKYNKKLREKVAAHHFRWDPDRGVWWRVMAVEDAATLPFKVWREDV